MAIEDDDNIKGLLSGWGLSGKPCDSCHSSTSLLFCRQHSAYLCSPCDTDIHRHNPHERVWVCEVCEQAPAAFTCKADAAALCVSCDRDIHSANPLSQRHQRLPIVPFLQTPAASGSFIVPNDDDVANGRAVDAWMIPDHKLVVSPAAAGFVFPSDFGPCNSDLSSSTGFGGFEQQCEIRDVVHEEAPHLNVFDSIVPMATTNQNSIHYSQQREKKFGTTTTTTTTNCFEIDFTQSKLSPFNYSSSICQSHSVSSSDVGVVPDGISNSMSEVSNFPFTKSIDGGIGSVMTEPPVQLSRAEREARVMRYREKRKNRKFEKTIRYASRKAYAESRPRIKGRFAKRNSDPDEDAEMFSISGGGFVMVDHGGYGVVPSF